MASQCVRAAGATELGLVIAKYLFNLAWLPLGGSHIAQVGIVLGFAFVVSEYIEIFWPSGPSGRAR